MTKTYAYRGYAFHQTDITTEVYVPIDDHLHRKEMRYIYEIEDLKPAGRRPFLTTVQECRDYITRHLQQSGIQPPSADELLALSFRDLLSMAGLSQSECSRRFHIPLRTVQNWARGENTCPSYVRLMMAELTGLLPSYTPAE